MNAEFYYEKEVSTSIEDFCKQKNIKESEFAAIVDVNAVQLSRIKSGKSSSYETLCKIAVAVGKDVKHFLKPAPLYLVQSVKTNLAIEK